MKRRDPRSIRTPAGRSMAEADLLPEDRIDQDHDVVFSCKEHTSWGGGGSINHLLLLQGAGNHQQPGRFTRTAVVEMDNEQSLPCDHPGCGEAAVHATYLQWRIDDPRLLRERLVFWHNAWLVSGELRRQVHEHYRNGKPLPPPSNVCPNCGHPVNQP